MSLLPNPPTRETTGPASTHIPVATPTSPLNESHYQLIQLATIQRRPIRKAARTARGSAMTILVIAAASTPLLVFSPSWQALFVVAGIWVIGVREYIGAQRMRKAEPSAATYLCYNQLAFIALIIIYCLMQMMSISGAKARGELISPEVQSQLAMLPSLQQDVNQKIEFWAPLVYYGFYSLVIVLSAAIQGGLAYYYFARKQHLDALAQHTPAWIQRLFTELDA